MKAKFNQAAIKAVATCVPSYHINIDDELFRLYHGNKKRLELIKSTIGLNKRHIVRAYTSVSELIEVAALDVIANADIDKSKIDAIIVVTQTPDFFTPCTAAYLHGRLGLSQECAMFDVNQGCAGYIYGLWLSFMMIQSGSASNVLLCAGDTVSRMISQHDSNITPIIGDAGSVSLISRQDGANSYFRLYSDGTKFDTIICPDGAFKKPRAEIFNDPEILKTTKDRNLSDFYMNGTAVFGFVMDKIPALIDKIIKDANLDKDEIDYLLLHQANELMVSRVVKIAGFSLEKAPNDVTNFYGNLSCASIPAIFANNLSDKVGKKPLKLVMAGFGVGLSWGACALEIDKIYAPKMLFLDE